MSRAGPEKRTGNPIPFNGGIGGKTDQILSCRCLSGTAICVSGISSCLLENNTVRVQVKVKKMEWSWGHFSISSQLRRVPNVLLILQVSQPLGLPFYTPPPLASEGQHMWEIPDPHSSRVEKALRQGEDDLPVSLVVTSLFLKPGCDPARQLPSQHSCGLLPGSGQDLYLESPCHGASG